jgi:hypothetical protein
MVAVQRAMDAREYRVDRLTDMVFHMHHPERDGRSIGGNEPELVAEWKAFRVLIESLVRHRGSTVNPDGEGPLDGYLCASFGGAAKDRLDVAEARACAKNPGRRIDKLKESDILFLSGHHYAGYDEPMNFDAIDLRKYRFVAPRVRLIMVSSCNGLRPNSLRNFRKKFPNAYILGWRSKSPLEQHGLMRKFIETFVEPVELSTAAGVNRVIRNWKGYVENLPRGSGKVGVYGLGYATPDGKNEWWDGKIWHTSLP